MQLKAVVAERLALALNAPVCTTVSGKGSLADTHPLKVGVVGANGGYSAAVLAEMAGSVVALESDRDLAASASSGFAMSGTSNVQVVTGDLAAGPAWPVAMAYFPDDDDRDTPDYELLMSVGANGVAHHLVQDFGGFTLAFELVNAEPVAGPSCQ